MADVLAEYRAVQRSRGLAEGTITAREYQLRSWMAYVPDPWRATPSDVRSWVGQRERGPNSQYSMVSHLHRFYVWAIGEGYAIEDPTTRVERQAWAAATEADHRPRTSCWPMQTAEDPLLRATLLLATASADSAASSCPDSCGETSSSSTTHGCA